LAALVNKAAMMVAGEGKSSAPRQTRELIKPRRHEREEELRRGLRQTDHSPDASPSAGIAPPEQCGAGAGR